MTATATLVYTAFLGGGSSAGVAAAMAAVPVPPDILNAFGLRLISDATPVASPVVRTIVLGLNPIASATATATLEASGDSGSPVESITVTAPGSGYIRPPVISFTGGRPVTPVQEIPFTGPQRFMQNLDDSADSPSNQFQPQLNASAAAVAFLKAVSASFVGGAGYSAATFIQVKGQLKSSGSPPTLTATPPPDVGRLMVLVPTITLGAITAVTIVDPGSGYTGVPTITVVDPSVTPGSGGSVSVSMGVERIDVLREGAGYNAAPTVVLTPLFQALFPAGVSPFEGQQRPFRNLMNTALEQALTSPVSAATPVIV
jgi:hypothetical protein